NADHTHHAALLMLQDVTVEHPVAGVVGDEGDLDLLARSHQHGILPLAILGRCSVAADDAEGVSVQVHWMPPRRLVVHRKHVGTSAFEREHGIHDVACHGDTIDEPDFTAVHHFHHVHAAHAAVAHHHLSHHAAIERDLMALGGTQIRLGPGVWRESDRTVERFVAD